MDDLKQGGEVVRDESTDARLEGEVSKSLTFFGFCKLKFDFSLNCDVYLSLVLNFRFLVFNKDLVFIKL